jgi:hypothetical protein
MIYLAAQLSASVQSFRCPIQCLYYDDTNQLHYEHMLPMRSTHFHLCSYIHKPLKPLIWANGSWLYKVYSFSWK